jgi:dCTP diphosphatase
VADLQELIERIKSFRDERNWKQFHTPRNLAAALAVEASELQETMLWKTDPEVDEFLKTTDGRTSVASEIADVLIFSLLLRDVTASTRLSNLYRVEPGK